MDGQEVDLTKRANEEFYERRGRGHKRCRQIAVRNGGTRTRPVDGVTRVSQSFEGQAPLPQRTLY